MTTVNLNVKKSEQGLIPFGSIILVNTAEEDKVPHMLISTERFAANLIELASGFRLSTTRNIVLANHNGATTREIYDFLFPAFGSDTSFKVLRNTTININGEVDD